MAMRRHFPYRTVLRVRRLEQDLKAQRLAEVQRKIQRATRDRTFIAREQMRMLDEVGRKTRERFDAWEIRQYYVYERHLARRAVEKDAEIASLRRLERERLRELEKAAKRKRIVERLDERYAQAFQKELRSLGQKALDEAAVSRVVIERIKRRTS